MDSPILFRKLDNIFSVTSRFAKIWSIRTRFELDNWRASKSCVSSSKQEPMEISMKCLNSFWLLLLLPSAILDGIETPARVIWDPKPYFSLDGRPERNAKQADAIFIPICQTLSDLKFFIAWTFETRLKILNLISDKRGKSHYNLLFYPGNFNVYYCQVLQANS